MRHKNNNLVLDVMYSFIHPMKLASCVVGSSKGLDVLKKRTNERPLLSMVVTIGLPQHDGCASIST